MRFKVWICAVAAAGAMVSASAAGTYGSGALAASTSAPEGEYYVLREHDGYVGVFSPEGGKTPVHLTDIQVKTLPETDRRQLNEGISVSGDAALAQLLEDLGS